MSDTGPVRILIADEQALLREAVRSALEAEPDFIVVGEAGTQFHAIAEAERSRPHVAIVDARLPGGGGLRAAREIADRVPGTRVLVLSGQQHERTLVAAVESGVAGFTTKESPLADLIEAVRAIVRGETVVPARMLGPLLKEFMTRRREGDEIAARMSRLTVRESQVLRLLASGADNAEIGSQLGISPQTARTHVQNILSKLEVHSRLEAAALVMGQSGEDGSDLEDTDRSGHPRSLREAWGDNDLRPVR